MRRLSFVLILLIAGAGVALVQPFPDPWHRPLNPSGGSAGITYGTVAPSIATTGQPPGQAEVWMDTNGASDSGPLMMVYDHVNGAWDAQLSSGPLTNNVVTKFDGTELADSSITDNAVDVVATAGLVTSGTAVDAANSILLDGNNNTLQFEGGTADGGEIMFLAVDPATDVIISLDNPAGGAGSGTLIEVAATLGAQDVGATVIGLHLDLASPADHLGAAVIRGIEVDNSLNTATGEETGLHFTTGWDAEIHFADPTATLWWLETGSFTMQDYGGSIDLILTDMPDYGAADSFVSSLELDATIDIMDAGDTYVGSRIDLTNANHTGGSLYALYIDNITQDPQATEIGFRLGSGFDVDMEIVSSTGTFRYANLGTLTFRDVGAASNFILRDVPAAGTAADLMELDVTLSAMDGAGDTFRAFYIDIENAAHAGGGAVIGVDANLSAAVAGAVETAYLATGDWDYTLRQTGVAFAALPAAAAGAMVYCTNCDLGSVPCAATPGPGAWAFGTSTGPRWECPW